MNKLLVVVDGVPGVIIVSRQENENVLYVIVVHVLTVITCHLSAGWIRLPLFVLQRCLTTIDLQKLEYLLLCHIKEFHMKLTKSTN